MIIAFFIECKNENERNNLESILYSSHQAVYDATEHLVSSEMKTLEDIEILLENK